MYVYANSQISRAGKLKVDSFLPGIFPYLFNCGTLQDIMKSKN